jgi:predicted amidohydrolase
MLRKYTVALVQMNSQDHIEENLKTASAYIAEAAGRGARLVSLPEVMNFIGDRTAPGAPPPEDEQGPTFQCIAGLAKKYGLYIHGGSWAERKPGENRSYNTSFLFSPQGTLTAKYRKLHTFDITLPDGGAAKESERIAAGDRIVTAETELGIFGFSICYDLRFPELFRLLALRGAQIIFLPANFTTPTGKDHWEPLLRARAIENSCYMIAAGQWGKNARMTAYGQSMVVDPWGTVNARAREGAGLTLADIDLDYLDDVRARMQTLANRRPDVYGLTYHEAPAPPA